MNYDILFQQALKFHENGRLNEAEAIYRSILETAPDNPDVINLLGLIAQSKGLHEDAVSLFYRAVTLSPRHVPYRFNLAFSLQALGRLHEAADLYQQITVQNPELKEAWNNLAQTFFDLGEKEKSLTAAGQAAALDAGYVEPRVTMALCSSNPEDELQKLCRLFPSHPLPPYRLSLLYRRGQNFPEALNQALKALELDTQSPEIIVNAAGLYNRRHDDVNAEKLYRRALELDSRSVPALVGLASVLSRKKDFASAEPLYKQALDLSPKDIDALINYADMLYHAGRLLEALETCRQAVILAPHRPEISNNLGIIQKDLKEYDEALGLFFNALEKDRTCGEYAVNIAETLVLMHRDTPDKALQIAQNWVKNYPENPLAHHTLASFGGSSPAYDSAYSHIFFDNFASGYEETLSHLNYCLPQKIKQLLGTVKGTVLDLGCGTGLIAETLASADNHFIGVDISSQMLEIARSKQLYRELINQDILAYLQSRPLPRPDLIIAADVFCYMAELGPVFNLCAPCPLCFSIEKGTANSSCLMPSGRYTHHPDYIKHLLTSAGYSKINQYDIILRQENHQDVPGLIYIAR